MAISSNFPADNSISQPFIHSSTHRQKGLVQSVAQKLHAWICTQPPSSKDPESLDTLAIVCISDTHGCQPALPDGEILLHAGDLSKYGLFDEIQAQLTWLAAQPHRHKIVIGGNHDLILDPLFVAEHPDRELDKPKKSRGDLNWGDVKYLCNSSVEIKCGERTLKIYGSPATPRCGTFAFQYEDSNDVWANTVPRDTDVLLTHGPPALHLDGEKGCQKLLKEIWRVRPSLVVCGHIHSARGQEWMSFDRAQAYYESTLLSTGILQWANMVKLVFYVMWCLLMAPLKEEKRGKLTHLVNAAVTGDRNTKENWEPVIVTL